MAAVVFEVAQVMEVSLHHPFLIGLASVTTPFCFAEHFAH